MARHLSLLCLSSLLVAVALGPAFGCAVRGSNDDDSAVGDDDDVTGDDDDATGDDDDATGDDDDATGDDDDATGDDDDATGDDDDATPFVVSPGDVVVTEVMTNPGAVDDTDGEWVEVNNRTAFAIDLSGWILADRGSDSVVLSPGVPLVLSPNGFLVFGRDDSQAVNGGAPVNWAYGAAMELANGSDEVVLFDDTGVEIFGLNYSDSFLNPSGVSGIHPGAPNWPSMEDETTWCLSPAGGPSYGLGDLGSPGAANPEC